MANQSNVLMCWLWYPLAYRQVQTFCGKM